MDINEVTNNALNIFNCNPNLSKQATQPDLPGSVKAVMKDYTVDLVSSRMPEDSSITYEWLAQNPSTARMIAMHPNLVNYLNENSDHAEKLMEGIQEGQRVITEFFVEQAPALLDEESPISDEWLIGHQKIAGVIAGHPGLSDYLNNNPDQAEKLMEMSV